ncbi:MAG: cupredoxin domain-containing protein [Patescibacteria group bacterium]
MTKREISIVGVALLVVALGVGIALLGRNGGGSREPVGGLPGEGAPPAATSAAPVGYAAEIPRGATLSVPEAEAPAAPGVEEKLRMFTIAMNEDGFTPKTITVNRGDVVNVTVYAEDGGYDFSVPYLGLYQSVPRGERKKVSFGANQAGTFAFGCRDRCPAVGKISGSFIVLP